MGAHAFKGSFIAVLAGLAIVAMPALSSASVKSFMVAINGAQETPPNPSTAIGNGILTFDTATKTLCYSVSYIGALGPGDPGAHTRTGRARCPSRHHPPASPGEPQDGVHRESPSSRSTRPTC